MDPKNLLFIMSDEHNPRMMGCSGHTQVKTPHLDALAARGARFRQAYTPCPICVPARASLATGRHVHETGCWDNVHAYRGEQPSWGHRLREAGHRAVSIGKLHYLNETDDTGFDEQIIPMHIIDGGGDIKGLLRNPLPGPRKASKFATDIGPGESSYTKYDRKIVTEAQRWLAFEVPTQDKPWALFVSFVCPHHPLIAPQAFYDLYPVDRVPNRKLIAERHPWIQCLRENRNHEDFFTRATVKVGIASYFGLCSFLDHNIGLVLQALEDAGLTDSTRVIYTSDHGENLGNRELWGKNNMYEESAGIPMIVAGPGVPAGRVVETPSTLLDCYPSILEGVGLDPRADGFEPRGRSLWDMAASADDPERVIFSEYHAAASPSAAFMLKKGRYKFIHYVGYQPELFDLHHDPEELTNLATDPAHAQLVTDYERMLREVCDPDAQNARAFADQKRKIESLGGYAALQTRGYIQGTPPPGYEPELLA